MEIKDLRQIAKAKGIKNWHNKKEENLLRDISAANADEPLVVEHNIQEELEAPEVSPEILLQVTDKHRIYLNDLGVAYKWILDLANKYNFDKIEYVDKFKAFKCYKENKALDWVSINELSSLNDGPHMVEIVNHYRPLNKNKQIIAMNWRK